MDGVTCQGQYPRRKTRKDILKHCPAIARAVRGCHATPRPLSSALPHHKSTKMDLLCEVPPGNVVQQPLEQGNVVRVDETVFICALALMHPQLHQLDWRDFRRTGAGSRWGHEALDDVADVTETEAVVKLRSSWTEVLLHLNSRCGRALLQAGHGVCVRRSAAQFHYAVHLLSWSGIAGLSLMPPKMLDADTSGAQQSSGRSALWSLTHQTTLVDDQLPSIGYQPPSVRCNMSPKALGYSSCDPE